MMWFLLLLIYIAHTELVIAKGENRLILSGGSHPCEGYVEIYHDNQWGYVGDKYWNKTTEKVVCSSTHCGSPLENSTKDVARPKNSTVWLNELRCNGEEENLWQCSWPGWGVSVYRKPSMKMIKCSNEIKISLSPFECAGAVQYSIDGKTRSGYFCADGWEQNEADELCKNLGCGKSKERSMHEWMIWKDFENSKKMKINCSGIKNWKNPWQCVTKEPTCAIPASVVCEAHERLQLRGDASNVCSGQLEKMKNGTWSPFKNETSLDVRCQQMNCGASVSHSLNDKGTQLTCEDKVNVVLKDGGKPSKCYGAVHVNVNGESFPVCASRWTKNEAEVVCKELNCGNVISHSDKKTSSQLAGMDSVHCLGSESSLWHCQAKRNSSTLMCSSRAYVVCAGSISVRLKDGPGKCAGRVEVQYEGRWRAYKNEWSEKNSEIVCKQINCGSEGQVSHNKFSKGSDDFLTTTVNCRQEATTISDCLHQTSNNPSNQKERLEITCEEHKMVFLKGNGSNPCSGMVGIEHGKKTYWLSGSKTWNQESANIVCHQKHCGNASTFSTSIPTADMLTNIWNESYNCSSNTKSLFECEAKMHTPGPNDTIATVTCTGTVTMTLTNKCWGHVLANVDGKRGGVCGDSWTEEHSKMLCESINCGDTVLESSGKQGQEPVLITSLHRTDQTTSLTQCNVVLNDDKDMTCNQNQAYVVCSGSVRPRFSSSRDKCSGNVEVLYEGKWLPVCTDALKNKEAQDIMCEELECGKAVDKIAYIGPQSTGSRVISQLQCPTNGAKSITACKIIADYNKCTPVGLQCADWRKMKVSDTCKGHVSVYSNGKRYAVSSEGWNVTEGRRLCQDLNCGRFHSFESTVATPSFGNISFWDGHFSCVPGQDQKNIWDCEKKTSPASNQQLFIECQDVPEVKLAKTCQGEVTINNMKVCNSSWDGNYSHLLCQEQNCSNAIVSKQNFIKPEPNTEYHHVSCDDNDHKLGQCVRVKGKCDGELVSVYCVANVMFNTTEKCGGQILVNYGNDWEKVCPLNISVEFMKMLCQELKCGNHRNIVEKTKKAVENMKVALECKAAHMDVKHCVVEKFCKGKPAEIYCEAYVDPTPEPPASQTPIVPIILGVGFFLVLVILVVVFVRICIVKKAKTDKNVRSRMLSRNEVEFESGDYEDIRSKENEMEDLSRSRFIIENDARSTSSFPYDDIDEAADDQPMTSQAATDGALRDNYVHEDTLDQSEDGVTYEVNDPQDNYDDIEVSPEIPQTKAEVHDSPITTSERNTVAPSGLVQEDADYLEPDQDG